MENKQTYTAPKFWVEELEETDVVLVSFSDEIGSLPTYQWSKNISENTKW